MIGILSHSCYVPRYRLNRRLIYKAVGWIDPSTAAHSRGERAVANFDEDSITLAVAAASQAMKPLNRSEIDGIYFSSTSMPYKERLNASILSGALGLKDTVRGADFSGGLKAGTTAMLSGIEAVQAKGLDQVMVAASDCRIGKPGSPEELIFGDAAAAFVLGSGKVIAEYKGSYSVTHDFMDHFRGENAKFDRKWEDRWIRDMGYNEMVPATIQGLLDKYGLKISDFSKVVYDCQYAASRRKFGKVLGITPEMDQDNFQLNVGHCGVAQSLMMLSAALQQASPGDKLLVVSFGSGCDAIYFEVTDEIKNYTDPVSFQKELDKRVELEPYEKFLAWRDVLPVNTGLRSEEDLWTRPSVLWRHRKEVMGLWGTRCLKCGTPQYPAQRVCVNPECGAIDEMEDYLFADKIGNIFSYTGDALAASLNPPTAYGAVTFEGGGKYYFEFTDCDMSDLSTGMPVSMSFRRKYKDDKRGISGYFWKAVPMKEEK